MWVDKTVWESFLLSSSHMVSHWVITSCATGIMTFYFDRKPVFIQKKMTGRVFPEISWSYTQAHTQPVVLNVLRHGSSGLINICF